jgi:DNA-binding NarL/FixJ family response regulator
VQRGDSAIIILLLILSASLNPKNLENVTEAGADEILDKFATPGELVGAIRRLGTGK